MGRKKITDEEKVKAKVTYDEIKPQKRNAVDRDDYMIFLKIYHHIRPYLDRELPKISKKELVTKFPKHKEIAENVWDCIYDLKLKWTNEMVDRVLGI